MALKIPNLYQAKKILMYPRKVYMRHKENFEPGFMRSAMELHYYRPAFYKWLKARSADEHLLHDANINSNSVVLDVGAYIGEWSREVIDLYNPTIHAFEPDPRNYRELKKRMPPNSHLIAYNFGLGDENLNVRITQEYLGSSVISDAVDLEGIKWTEAEIRDIADIWTSLALDRVEFMKINIEGAEFPLLERMIESNLLEKVDCFLIQFHEWHPGAYRRRRRIRKILRKTHRLEWDYHFVWEKWILKE